ncbi:MAG TPA: alpha/beta family hydrolase [Thermodesulfobacteriota bacterium]
MNPVREAFALAGPAGPLEALYEVGVSDRGAAALVLHPHPLHGGTMHNKVVYRLARALRRAGLATLRINFRGVGASAGRYGEGRGEVEDARAALDWLAARRAEQPLWVAGFSFGAWVGVTLGASDPRVVRVVAAGLPVRLDGLAAVADLGHRPLLVVQGEHDEHGPPSAVRDALAARPTARLRVVPGTDHFFEGRLDDLEREVLAFAEEGLDADAGPSPRP